MMLIFIILNLLMFTTSFVYVFRFSPNSHFSEKLVASFLIFISQVTFTILFLGVVIKNLGFVPIITLNCAISIAILLFLRNHVKEAVPYFFSQCKGVFSYLVKSKDFFLYIMIFLFSIQALVLIIKIYFLPPDVWDVFAYHMHPVVEWFQQNMISGSIDTPVTRLNRNPMGTKLIHFWIVKFTGDLNWAEFPQFIYGLMVSLTSYALMLKMNIRKNSALRYAVIIYFIPLIIIESRTCQDHLALMSVLLIAFLYFINVFLEKNYSHLLFLGLSAGLVLGTKISGAHIILIFLPVLFLTKGFNFSPVMDFIKKNILRLVLAVSIMLILGGFWYFKDLSIWFSYLNTIQRINAVKLAIAGIVFITAFVVLILVFKKFHVMNFFKNKKVIIAAIILISIIVIAVIVTNTGLIKIFILGHESPSRIFSDKNFYSQYPLIAKLKSDFTKNVLSFPFRIKDVGMYIAYTPDFLEQSGFGVQFFGFCLVAYGVMFFLVFRKKYRDSIAGYMFVFSVTLLGTYFIYYYSLANYRLFMFFPVFGLMLWAFLLSKWDIPSYYLKFIDVLIIIMIVFNFTTTVFEGNMDSRRWKNILSMDNTADRSSIKYSPFFKGKDWIFIDKYLRPEEPVGYLGHYDSWIFPYFDHKMKRRIFYLRSLPGFNLTETGDNRTTLEFNPAFKDSLKERKIHFIHINPQGIRSRSKNPASILIDDREVVMVTDNLYYFKW